ncbi:MAG: methyltransferase domain-containing protein [Alphaproteobacteria bacterium]
MARYPAVKPGLLDYLDLWLLRAAKLRRRPHDDDAGFYDSFFTEADVARYRGDVRNAWRYGRLRAIYRSLFDDRRARVADIGCGLGMAVLYLPADAEYVGVEFAPATLATARRLHGGRPGTEFRQGGFPDLPLPDASVDLAICTEVIEHIADDTAAITDLYRILAPGGHLLLTVPSTYYWPDYERLIGHYRHYTGPALAERLAAHGFRVVRRLPQHNAFWRRYHYRFVLLRAVEALLRAIVRRDFSIYDTAFYRAHARRVLDELASRDADDDPASTFVLACRPAVGR